MTKFPQHLIRLARQYDQGAAKCDALLGKLEDELSIYAHENGLIAEGKDVGELLYRLLDSLPEIEFSVHLYDIGYKYLTAKQEGRTDEADRIMLQLADSFCPDDVWLIDELLLQVENFNLDQLMRA